MPTQNAHIHAPHQGLAPHDEAAMSRLFAFIARWQAARRAARLRRIQEIASKGLSAIE